MTEISWELPERVELDSLAPAIRNRILGQDAERMAQEASIISFCWSILAKEQKAQAKAGKPPLSDGFIMEYFGPEYIIDIRSDQE